MDIFILRRSGPDDSIQVRRQRDGNFRTTQKDGECRRRQTQVFTGNELFWQLNVVVTMLTTDVLPFHRVQISAPGFPSVMQSMVDMEAHAPGWNQFAQVLRQYVEGRPWGVTQSPDEDPSGRSDGTTDEDDARSVPGVLPSVPRWVP